MTRGAFIFATLVTIAALVWRRDRWPDDGFGLDDFNPLGRRHG